MKADYLIELLKTYPKDTDVGGFCASSRTVEPISHVYFNGHSKQIELISKKIETPCINLNECVI